MHIGLKTRLLSLAATAGVALLSLAHAPVAQAMTAEQYFADGNRLFRDDLYWAALLRYRQAADGGLDTPLLHYNTGVAHYRAGQHVRARPSLERALASPELRDVVHYNLGLNAWALGETEEALRWLRLARDQQNNEKIARFAVIAIARIRDAQQPDPIEERVVERRRQEKQSLGDLEFRARVSFGTDDNVFRSPSQNYVDFSDPNLAVVTPEVKSGAYMPVSLSAKYRINTYRFEGFYGAYRLAGRYYQDKELENANEFLHELSFGSEYRGKKDSRKREVYSAFKIAQHDEVYYDPDDGLARDVQGVNIDDRMNYVRFGPELRAKQQNKKLGFGIEVKGQLWNYEETVVVPEYDHEYFLFRANTQYKFTSTSLLRLTVEKSSRRYGDRPSFDLDGAQRQGNPNVRYDYLAATLTARQRITDSMWFGVDYQRSERTDKYVGYNDYSRDSYGFEFHWSPGERFELDAKGYYRIYDYPNAFAFHNPIAGLKTHETAQGKIAATFHMTKSLSLVAEGSYRGAASTDTRIAYDRYQYVLGVRWEP
jgi:hypothetical protein